ncbi:hypothetical protein NUITMVS1_35970 [Shewanella xiamenensis]|nr:hypothetical protein NUITMVS1_35970 [Shewanella xiamenensis]
MPSPKCTNNLYLYVVNSTNSLNSISLLAINTKRDGDHTRLYTLVNGNINRKFKHKINTEK